MSDLRDEMKNSQLTERIFKDVKYYVSGEIQDEILELLKEGGAERMKYFTDYVTHLICGLEPNDSEVSEANELYEVPAVTTKWVRMSVKLNRLVNVKPYTYNTTKLFTNLVFCFSKIGDDLNTLWSMITYNGGTVQLNLNKNCTHLVTTNTTTTKYFKALTTNNIQIITPDWIVESIRSNKLAIVELFHPTLIQWPKISKHESTTAITGFEPEDLDEKAINSATSESTQALLDNLKKRMPWNQVNISGAEAPPNTIAPSFIIPKNFNQTIASVTTQQQETIQQQNIVVSTAQQVPRSIVHHTPQQFAHVQNAYQQQQQQQRLIGQPQTQQQRPLLQNQMAHIRNQLAQLPQQIMQRPQQIVTNQPVIPQPTQLMQPQQQQQNVTQRIGLAQINKTVGIQMQEQPQQQILQHNQQLTNQNQPPQFGGIVQQQQQQQPAINQQQAKTMTNQFQQQQFTSTAIVQQQFNQGQHYGTQQQTYNQQQPQQFVQGQNPQQLLQRQQQLVQGTQQFPQNGQQQQLVGQPQPQPQQPFSQGQPRQVNQHLWQQQQQQQQQMTIRHPAANIIQQPQGGRLQWSPNQQQNAIPPTRQYIHLDAQTHQQLQQMAPEQRALFVAKIQQKQRQIFLQKQQIQQLQQQRGGHILIRGSVPPGLNQQQQMQWLQQQAKQQGIVLQSNIQHPNMPPANLTQSNLPQNVQHTPGLSPIQQNSQFVDQNQQQLLQRQYRLQQLQLQREQAQKNAQGQLVQQSAPPPPPPLQQQQQPPPPPNIIRPVVGVQPQPVVDANVPPPVSPSVPAPVVPPEQPNVPQHPLVVNAKTKTALANMLSIRLQSGGSALGTGTENITEPSAAGTLRLMTAQHNAALNSNARPQDLLALQQRRPINGPNGEIIRPVTPTVPTTPQPEPPKLQYSPRAAMPIQHRPGPFYGHNPNLKLPPDLFLLGCVFVVVELERYLEESLPGWQQKIEKHGGEIERQYCSRVTHVLCETQRHGVVMQALRDYKRCVTLYWLSDVIKRKQVLPPWTALHLPTMYLDTTPASKHLISLSGFGGFERNRVKHMIKYTGATLTTYFTKHNTLLIAARPEGPKYMNAKKWGTPVVNVQWLTDIMLGNFSALNQMEHIKYQQFNNPPNFSFDPVLVPNLMQAWKMPINISQDSYERVKRSASPVVLPKKVKKVKTEHATDENDNVDNQGVQSNVYRLLFSMCSSVGDLKKIVRQLGGSLANDHTDCTHLIMPQLARTNKLLYCVCRGVHILPESWLRDSLTANKFLDESSYTFDTKEFNREYKCDFGQTLATRNKCKLFEGKCFFVTPSVFPSRKTIVELIQNCGGTVERIRRTSAQIEATNINSPYSYIIVTQENDLHLVGDLLKNKKEKIRIVCSVELIFSAILKQTFEVEPYTVKVL